MQTRHAVAVICIMTCVFLSVVCLSVVNVCWQAVERGSSDALLAAAAATHNSLCGLHPSAIALQAMYDNSSSTSADPNDGGAGG